MIRPLWIWSTQRRRSRFLSTSTTSASMPAAIHAAFHPTLPAPKHDDLGRAHAGRAAHQHAAAALVALEEVGALLRRQPAGDLAHRGQQRQRTRVELHRLVGERRRAGGDQRLGDVGVGGEVEVGEQRRSWRRNPNSSSIGSLTLTTSSCAQASSAVGTMSAPAAT